MESDNMNIITIIALVGMAVLGWLWFKKPSLKGAPARTWPAARGKMVAKPKLTTSL